jgi:hypothetical protein
VGGRERARGGGRAAAREGRSQPGLQRRSGSGAAVVGSTERGHLREYHNALVGQYEQFVAHTLSVTL